VIPGAKVAVPEAAMKSLPEVAVPAAVPQLTVTVLPLGADNVRPKLAFLVPLFPSVRLTFPIETVGAGSSSVIVTVWIDGEPTLAFVAELIRNVKVSLFSSRESPMIGALTAWELPLADPIGKVTTPDAAV
jgi:hypothetical protein